MNWKRVAGAAFAFLIGVLVMPIVPFALAYTELTDDLGRT